MFIAEKLTIMLQSFSPWKSLNGFAFSRQKHAAKMHLQNSPLHALERNSPLLPKNSIWLSFKLIHSRCKNKLKIMRDCIKNFQHQIFIIFYCHVMTLNHKLYGVKVVSTDSFVVKILSQRFTFESSRHDLEGAPKRSSMKFPLILLTWAVV